MKFICKTSELSDAVTNVQRAVSTKSSLAALEGVLISASAGKLTLSGYDLEIAIRTTVQANVAEEGNVVINAKLLGDILRKAGGENITLSVDEKLVVTIKSGVSEFSIMAINAADYPELPSISDNASLEISCDMLRSMVSQTIFAVSTNETRPVHTGILFEVENNNLRLVAVDGFRLAIRNEHINTEENLRFVVPAKTLSEILKMITEEDEKIMFQIGARHISFNVGNFYIISRLLEGEFLDYHSAIPNGVNTVVTADTRTLINSIDRISLIITDRLKSPVRCTFENNKAYVRCVTEIGKASDFADCNITGEPIEIGFNNKYFIDALRAADTDMVKIELKDPTSPIKIMPLDSDSFLFLVVPVRLKIEA